MDEEEEEYFTVSDGKHVAGPMAGCVQRCIHCGGMISDYRNAMTPNGEDFPSWAEGVVITVTHNGKAFGAYDDKEWLFCYDSKEP
jgi:hypothetical protein